MFRYVTRDTLIPIRRLYPAIPNGAKAKLTVGARTALIQAMFHDVMLHYGSTTLNEPFKKIPVAAKDSYARFPKQRALFMSKATNTEWEYITKTCRSLVEDLLKEYSLLTVNIDSNFVAAFNSRKGYELFKDRDFLVIRTSAVQYNGKTYSFERWPSKYLELINGHSKKVKFTFDDLFPGNDNPTNAEVKEKLSFMDNHDINYLLQRAIEGKKDVLR